MARGGAGDVDGRSGDTGCAQRHWAASDANDFAVEHEIYREDAVLHYPQSGERIRGRHNIQESRTVQPSEKRFAVQRITGNGDLWVTEFVLSYDGVPSYAVSIMEFSDGKVGPRDADTSATRSSPGRLGRTWSSRMIEQIWSQVDHDIALRPRSSRSAHCRPAAHRSGRAGSSRSRPPARSRRCGRPRSGTPIAPVCRTLRQARAGSETPVPSGH